MGRRCGLGTETGYRDHRLFQSEARGWRTETEEAAGSVRAGETEESEEVTIPGTEREAKRIPCSLASSSDSSYLSSLKFQEQRTPSSHPNILGAPHPLDTWGWEKRGQDHSGGEEMVGERDPYEGGLGVVSAEQEVSEVSAKSPGLRYSPGLENALHDGIEGTRNKGNKRESPSVEWGWPGVGGLDQG